MNKGQLLSVTLFFFIINVLIIILQLLTLESELAINFLWTFEMSWSDADIPF